MVIGYRKADKPFIYLYFITMTILLLSEVDTFTLGGLLRKFKYLYIVLMLCYMVYMHMFSKRQLLAMIPLIVLAVHAVLWGTKFVNYRVADATHQHVRECLIFYLFVLVTFYYVSVTHTFLLFVELSYISILCQLTYATLTHFNNLVNPKCFILIFNESERIRFTFGFTAWGYVGNYTYCLMALSFILFHYLKGKENSRLSLIVIACGDFLALEMACSAASRSTIIALALTTFYYFSFEMIGRQRNHKVIAGQITLVIIITGALIFYCITSATRGLNIEGNMDAFHQVGNLWTGMGYVENHGFQEGTSIYGVTTTSLDISYVYYFFTTGVLGCIFIGVAAVGLLLMVMFCKSKYKTSVLAILISMLIYAYWQVNLFSYSFYTTLIFMVIYMSAIAEYPNTMRNESIIKFYV